MSEPRRTRRGIIAVSVIAMIVAVFAAWWFSPGQQRKRQTDALIEAAATCDTKAVETALAGGVDVNARDANGITPLMHAARGKGPKIADPAPTDHPEVIELLVKHGAEVDAKTDSGFVALFWAARYGHDKVAKALIELGADVNAKDKDGMTAMRWATTNQQTKVVELLKAAGVKE